MPLANRILVVEDEELLAQNVKAFLARRSPDVRIASHGEEALAMLDSFSPDVAVLDYGLPGINGVQIYSEIVRRRGRHIGCVMITGYPIEYIADHASSHGLRHLLSKPFALTELQKLITLSAEEASRNS